MVLVLQLARLSADDMNAVNNMRYLGGSGTKKTSRGVFSLKFDVHRVNTSVPLLSLLVFWQLIWSLLYAVCRLSEKACGQERTE